jgi:hypothetical protein
VALVRLTEMRGKRITGEKIVGCNPGAATELGRAG